MALQAHKAGSPKGVAVVTTAQPTEIIREGHLMFQGIEVVKYYGEYTRSIYRFTLLEAPQQLDLLCTYFCSQIRETKRHKWETKAVSNVYDRRNSSLDFNSFEIPLDVIENAREQLIKKLSVRKWDRK